MQQANEEGGTLGIIECLLWKGVKIEIRVSFESRLTSSAHPPAGYPGLSFNASLPHTQTSHAPHKAETTVALLAS